MDRSHKHNIEYKTSDITEYTLKGSGCIKCQSRKVLPWCGHGRHGDDRGSMRTEGYPAILMVLAELLVSQDKVKAYASGYLYLKSYFGVVVETELLASVYQVSTGAELFIMSYTWSDHPNLKFIWVAMGQNKVTLSRWPNFHITNLYYTDDSPFIRCFGQWGILWDSLNFTHSTLAGRSPRAQRGSITHPWISFLTFLASLFPTFA